GTGEGDEERAQQRGEQAKRPGADAEESGLEPGEERDDGREVDVAERRMAAAVEVVELVGMETERAVRREMQREDAPRRTAKEQPRCERGRPLGGQSVRAERHRREVSSPEEVAKVRCAGG